MSQGRQFCVKDKIYEYTTATTRVASHKYSMKSEGTLGCDHSMSDDFFDEFFLPNWENPKTIPLEEDLFEI